MGFNKGERQSTPPPWGWPSAAEEKAHGVGEIVYHGAAKPTRHTKDRRHEQEKVYPSACSLTVSNECLMQVYDNMDYFKNHLTLRQSSMPILPMWCW